MGGKKRKKRWARNVGRAMQEKDKIWRNVKIWAWRYTYLCSSHCQQQHRLNEPGKGAFKSMSCAVWPAGLSFGLDRASCRPFSPHTKKRVVLWFYGPFVGPFPSPSNCFGILTHLILEFDFYYWKVVTWNVTPSTLRLDSHVSLFLSILYPSNNVMTHWLDMPFIILI